MKQDGLGKWAVASKDIAVAAGSLAPSFFFVVSSDITLFLLRPFLVACLVGMLLGLTDSTCAHTTVRPVLSPPSGILSTSNAPGRSAALGKEDKRFISWPIMTYLAKQMIAAARLRWLSRRR